MQDEYTTLLTDLFVMHNGRGLLQAELNWIECGDPDHFTKNYINKANEISTLNKHIKMMRTNLDLLLTDSQMNDTDTECESFTNISMEKQEIIIEKEHRPPNLGYNMKAIVTRTEKHIPEDILIGLSYGWKFMYPYVNTKENLFRTLSQIEMCIDDSIEPLAQHEAFFRVAQIIARRKQKVYDNTTQWLRFISLRAKRFFTDNEDIFATRSDKGGHTVINDVEKYDQEIATLLNNPCYTITETNPLKELVTKETKLMRFFSTNYKTRHLVTAKYEPEIKHLARMYGLPKVHKDNYCLRPITSMHSSPGHASGQIFDEILKDIFPRSHFHIKDSYEMKRFLDTTTISEQDVLVSFDVVSMYTNIPRNLVKTLIMRKAKEFHDKFGMGKKILNETLNFLLSESTYITALDNIYKQTEGLPMGGCISTTLARITMDEVVTHLLSKIPDISFIRVFVDDTIAAMKRESIEIALSVLNNFHPNIDFTHEVEKINRSINFLNLTLIREKNRIITNWYRKYFASGRLLPYFSSHKRTTVMATAQAFIQTVLNLSDPFFFHINKAQIERTLRNNGFPETKIMILMNKYYTYMKPNRRIEKRVKEYRIFPHALCETRKIKRVLHGLKSKNIIYSDSTKNTKINWVTTRKTRIPLAKTGNVIVKSKCLCGRKISITSAGFNETGEIASKRIINTISKCMGTQHAFRKAEYSKGLEYNKQTKYLVKYMKWINKPHNVGITGLPNYQFAKLLKNK